MTVEAMDILPAERVDADGRVRCAHCRQIVPRGLIQPSAGEQFCCAGCRAVYQTIHACGLESYYRLRNAADPVLKPARPGESSFDSFDSPSFHELYVHRREDGLAVTDLVLEGVSCAACVWLIERLPRVLEGVIEARLSLREATVRLSWDPSKLMLSRIAQTLDRIGYTPHPARGTDARELHRRQTRKRLIHLGVAGAIMGNTMLLALALYAGDAAQMEPQYRSFFRWISALLGTISLAWPGATFFRGAWAAIRARGTNLDVPIALALLVGGVAGLVNVILNRGEIYFDSLTVLVFLLLVGRFVQYRQQRRADDAVGLLFSLTPSSCRIVCGDETIEAPIEALEIDNVVEVRPGELFPADGIVQAGRSTVNQALLTGESMPVAVAGGSVVHAGSQNVESTLQVRVTKVGRDTRLAQLLRLIERGVQDKPPIVQFADRVGGWFIIAVSIAAAATFAYWARFSVSDAIDHAVALLIVTCPCVLGLATPLTIAIAIGKLARRDILVKSGVAIERLSRGGQILLDKTGTITAGKLQLLQWIGDTSVKPAVAELERRSNHPVGRALHAALVSEHDPQWPQNQITDVTEAGDGGVSGNINGMTVRVGSPRFHDRHGTIVEHALAAAVRMLAQEGASVVIVSVKGRAVAAAGLGDRIRDDSATAVAALRRLGWKAAILSGDAEHVVASVAQRVGVEPERCHAAMTPEQKLARVRSPDRAGNGVVVMVGDGVNDAAALAAADVGVAVHGGAEASLAAADVYIARPGLAPLVDLVQTSRRTMCTIRRNLAVSLSYNLLAGALAAAGMMSPLIAAIIMPVSSATVLWLAVASIGRTGRSSPGNSWK